MKKLFLALMMCLVSTALFADSTFAYDGVYYDTFSESLTARVATQSAYWNPSGDVIIHDEIEDPSGVVYTVTIIPFMAFYGSNIESISIPGTITSMGQFCIANCKSLKTVTFADELTSIGSCAFADDIALETIDLSNTVVTNISSQAFDGCTGLTSIVLPSTLTTLANISLRNCTSLSSVTCLAKTPPSLSTSTTPFTNVPMSSCTLYVPYGSYEAYATATVWKDFGTITELEDENTPLEDGDTFEYGGITYKVISAEDQTVEVTWAGESSTSGTDSYVGNITIPETVTYNEVTYTVIGVGEYAFYACKLISISLPETVGYIETYAFSTSEIVSIVISDYVTDLGENAFMSCPCLTDVVIGDGVLEIKPCTFYGTPIKDIILGNSITIIGTSAFFQCEELESIKFPDSLLTIDTQAFSNCTSLKEVTLGNAVESLSSFTFFNCTGLEEFYSPIVTPPLGASDSFTGASTSTCALYVPIGSKEDYSLASGWKDFYSIVEMTEFAIETLDATNITDTSATLNGSVTAAYDDPITEKGFEYWTGDSEAQKAVVEGDEMTAKVTDLESETTYSYRAYAVMESGTTEYGEKLTFTTTVPDGINGIRSSLDNENVEDIYTIGGQQISTPQKGVNIIRYTDGITKKIMIK